MKKKKKKKKLSITSALSVATGEIAAPANVSATGRDLEEAVHMHLQPRADGQREKHKGAAVACLWLQWLLGTCISTGAAHLNSNAAKWSEALICGAAGELACVANAEPLHDQKHARSRFRRTSLALTVEGRGDDVCGAVACARGGVLWQRARHRLHESAGTGEVTRTPDARHHVASDGTGEEGQCCAVCFNDSHLHASHVAEKNHHLLRLFREGVQEVSHGRARVV